MARTRRLAVDDDQSWVLRANYLASGTGSGSDIVDHADADYVYIASDGSGDDSGYFSVGMFTAPTTAIGEFTVWGKGVISLGPPTTEQIAFMAAAGPTTDLTGFPGAFITVGYHDAATTDLYVAIKDRGFTGYVNGYTQINFNDTIVTIFSDRIEIIKGAGTIDLGTGVVGTFSSETGPFRLAELITVNGTSGNDVIGATNAAQTVHGLGGDDTISGGLGGSDLYGDGGNDTLIGNQGIDRFFGGTGNDRITSGYGDSVDAGSGDDTVTAALNTHVAGGDGIDRIIIDLTGTALPRSVTLTDSPDGVLADVGITYTGMERFDLVGGFWNDTLRGNGGANTIRGGYGADIIFGGGGSDVLEAGIGGPSPEPVVTGSGASKSQALGIDDAFTPKPGALPIAQIEIEEIAFSGTDEYYSFDVAEGGHLIVAENDTQSLSPGYGFTLYNSSGTFVATNPIDSPLDVEGLPADRYILEITTNLSGRNAAIGLVDVKLSTATTVERHNRLDGGKGNDTFIVHRTDDVVIERANEGTDTVIADASFTLSDNVELLMLKAGAGAINGTGNVLANTITGNDSANMLKGGDGNDTLIGGGGSDNLRGEAGADRMEGGAGNDAYRGENTGDTVIEKAGEGLDRVVSSVTWTLSDNIEILNLLGADPLKATGNALANTLTGNDGDNLLDGRTGADTMLGGAGNDTYMVDNLRDRVYETSTIGGTIDAGGVDKVLSSVSYSIASAGRTFVENLTLSGTAALNGTGNEQANRLVGNSGANTLSGLGGADTLNGSSGNDKLYGGAGNDVLFGDIGNDRLDPGSGKDAMSGGAGSDIFVFTAEAVADAGSMFTADRINDFSHAERDRIDVRQIDANLLLAGDQAFTFLGTGAFTGQIGELRVEATATATFLVGDLNGDRIGDGYIRLAAGITLVAADLLL